MPDYNPETELDHFKFWSIKPKDFKRDLTLMGQFDEEKAIPQALERLDWIGNPVEKTFEQKHHGILHPEAHLLGYFLKQPETQKARWLRVKNQFHKKPVLWKLADPAMLLVPASKVHSGNPPPPPAVVDHFECYLVRDAAAVAGPVSLEDQFDKILKKKEEIKTLDPAFFCVPVSKNGEPIRNPKAHLALYDISDRVVPEKPIGVAARDQFKSWDLEVVESLMLGVPTEKVDWGEGEPREPTSVTEGIGNLG
jgi:hypothetical protein